MAPCCASATCSSRSAASPRSVPDHSARQRPRFPFLRGVHSMLRSLFSGVSGLRNNQTRMDVIGNNIANVNTVGFKAGRVAFKEGFAQLMQGASRPPGSTGGINPIQVGLGSEIGSIDTLFAQGNIETTGINTDLALQGNSFFVLGKGTNERYYSRAGNFQVDANGKLVSPTNGFTVQGRTAVNGVMSDTIGDIQLPF